MSHSRQTWRNFGGWSASIAWYRAMQSGFAHAIATNFSLDSRLRSSTHTASRNVLWRQEPRRLRVPSLLHQEQLASPIISNPQPLFRLIKTPAKFVEHLPQLCSVLFNNAPSVLGADVVIGLRRFPHWCSIILAHERLHRNPGIKRPRARACVEGATSTGKAVLASSRMPTW